MRPDGASRSEHNATAEKPLGAVCVSVYVYGGSCQTVKRATFSLSLIFRPPYAEESE